MIDSFPEPRRNAGVSRIAADMNKNGIRKFPIPSHGPEEEVSILEAGHNDFLGLKPERVFLEAIFSTRAYQRAEIALADSNQQLAIPSLASLETLPDTVSPSQRLEALRRKSQTITNEIVRAIMEGFIWDENDIFNLPQDHRLRSAYSRLDTLLSPSDPFLNSPSIENVPTPTVCSPIFKILALGGRTFADAYDIAMQVVPRLYKAEHHQLPTPTDTAQIMTNSYKGFIAPLAASHLDDNDELFERIDPNSPDIFSFLRLEGLSLKLVPDFLAYIKEKRQLEGLNSDNTGCAFKISSKLLQKYLDHPATWPNAMVGAHNLYSELLAA